MRGGGLDHVLAGRREQQQVHVPRLGPGVANNFRAAATARSDACSSSPITCRDPIPVNRRINPAAG
nr:hypothetical protein GCM10017745_44160 [Saccharothrix mutabilis subsp. capreolus]